MKTYGVVTVYPKVGGNQMDPRDIYIAGTYAFEMDDKDRGSAEKIVQNIMQTFQKSVRAVIPEHFTFAPRITTAPPPGCRMIEPLELLAAPEEDPFAGQT